MPSFIEGNDRRVIPNWREFKRTSVLGELNDYSLDINRSFEVDYIKDYLYSWERNATIGTAADLVNACFIAGIYPDEAVSAVSFLLSKPDHLSPELHQVATNLTGGNISSKALESPGSYDFDQFEFAFNPKNIYKKIGLYKQKVRIENNNPIAWVELSRLYSLLGQKERAIANMEIACFLSSNNRYVTRSAARLFIHYKDFERASYFLRKNKYLTVDPWILSIEISLAQIMQRFSKNFKKGLDLIQAHYVKPQEISELASALGTVELFNNKMNNSRKLFRRSLEMPNDNTLAQAEWALSKDLNLIIDKEKFRIYNPFEAVAIESFQSSKWETSLSYALKWLIDLPYSKRPAGMASYIAICLLKQYEIGEKICVMGLQANPKGLAIINNYSYLLALQNRTSDALNIYNKILSIPQGDIEENEKISLTATGGLILFRQGLIEPGRNSYDRALKYCQQIGNDYLYNIALLNLIREEMIIGSERVKPLKSEADLRLRIELNTDVLLLKDDVFMKYEQYIAGNSDSTNWQTV